MAKAKFEIGAEFDILNKGELDKSLTAAVAGARAIVREELRGKKYRRLPQLAGVASGGVLNIGGDAGGGPGGTWNGNPVGPGQGYAWEIKLLSVTGLTSGGATPDIVNLYILGAGSALAWWQFNGNNFAYTFGAGDLVLLPGERLQLQSVGTFAATGMVTLAGSVWQYPAEMFGKVAA